MARAPTKQDSGGIISSVYDDLAEAGADFVEAVPRSVEDTVRSTIAWGELFTGRADAYVRRYHDITVPEYRVVSGKIERTAGTVNTPVREYLNNLHSNRANIAPRWRRGLKDFLLNNPDILFKGQFDVVSKGDTLAVARDGVKFFSVSKAVVSTCFFGKATPEMLAGTIELLAVWVLYCREIRGLDKKKIRVGWHEDKARKSELHEYDIGDLQTMVDSFLGVDCNGFTGRYLKAKFPWLAIEPGTTEETYVKDETKVRKKLEDIRVDDTAVFNKNNSYHHVAMVSLVLSRTADEARLMLSESRSQHLEHGGPQTNVWVVKPQRDKAGKPIEGKFDIEGRDKEKFVKFVEPHSPGKK
jgi:hypothetical protein